MRRTWRRGRQWTMLRGTTCTFDDSGASPLYSFIVCAARLPRSLHCNAFMCQPHALELLLCTAATGLLSLQASLLLRLLLGHRFCVIVVSTAQTHHQL